MEAAFSLTTAYVNTRKQFGRPIGEYQALRHRIAEMAVALEMARSMAVAAAMAVDDPASVHAASDLPRAKLSIGQHARALCQQAIQSHGGTGMTEEYAVGHFLRRIHVLDHLFGDVDAQAARLARILIGHPTPETTSMKHLETLRLLGATLAALMAFALPQQAAQAADPFPSHPVRFIVPLGPGSGSDTVTLD